MYSILHIPTAKYVRKIVKVTTNRVESRFDRVYLKFDSMTSCNKVINEAMSYRVDMSDVGIVLETKELIFYGGSTTDIKNKVNRHEFEIVEVDGV